MQERRDNFSLTSHKDGCWCENRLAGKNARQKKFSSEQFFKEFKVFRYVDGTLVQDKALEY